VTTKTYNFIDLPKGFPVAIGFSVIYVQRVTYKIAFSAKPILEVKRLPS
jgi:hypothetical protein